LSVLVFVPIRFLYPSRSGVLRTLSLALSAVWAVTYAVLLVQYPDPHPLVAAASLAYVVYYWGVSLWMTARAARRRRADRVPA
jgi:phosphatidylcholine synthase